MTWLYERRLVPYDWSKLILAVNAKFEELAEAFPFDHPEEEVRKTGNFLKENIKDYATAKEVLRMLTESKTECAEKNFFGGYKHQLTKDWQTLVYIYEKGELYWAEQAKYLQQATCFDMTSLKKQTQS